MVEAQHAWRRCDGLVSAEGQIVRKYAHRLNEDIDELDKLAGRPTDT